MGSSKYVSMWKYKSNKCKSCVKYEVLYIFKGVYLGVLVIFFGGERVLFKFWRISRLGEANEGGREN